MQRHQVLLAKGPSSSSSLIQLNRDGNNSNQIDCGLKVQTGPQRSRYVQMSGGPGPRPEMAAPSDYKLRKRQALAKKEVVRRALAPPARRPTLRWLDFRPTPSRLCNVSMA